MSSDTPSRDRVYQVSSNRESASHKLRYVEGSAPASGECRLCVGSLAQAGKNDVPVTVQSAASDDIARLAFFEKQLYDNDAYSSLFFYQALRQWPRGFLTIKSDEKVKIRINNKDKRKPFKNFWILFEKRSWVGQTFGKS